jgi:hypothetical protein
MQITGSYCLILVITLIRLNTVSAQAHDTTSRSTEIIQDSRVDELVKKHIQINQVLNTMDGFRIQIFSDSGTSSKNKAQAAQEEFQAGFPGMRAYLTFKSPNYKVRIGDFRTKLDAQRFLIELTADYPNAFIIADQINFPNPD